MAGFFQSFCMIPMAVLLLRVANPALRGRVMGVRMLAVYGMPIGLLAVRAAGRTHRLRGDRARSTAWSGSSSRCVIARVVAGRPLGPCGAGANVR